jgi:hypothetical protein
MHRRFSGPRGRGGFARVVALSSLAAVALLAGCSDGIDTPKSPPVVPPQPPPAKDVIFAPATGPVATIRRTTGGVPAIKADDLTPSSRPVASAPSISAQARTTRTSLATSA